MEGSFFFLSHPTPSEAAKPPKPGRGQGAGQRADGRGQTPGQARGQRAEGAEGRGGRGQRAQGRGQRAGQQLGSGQAGPAEQGGKNRSRPTDKKQGVATSLSFLIAASFAARTGSGPCLDFIAFIQDSCNVCFFVVKNLRTHSRTLSVASGSTFVESCRICLDSSLSNILGISTPFRF